MRRRRPAGLILAAVSGALIALGLNAAGALDRAEFATLDQRFELRGTHEVPDDVVIVAIDDATLQRLGQFPFSRRHHAAVLRALTRAGARSIAYDVQFTEPSGDTGADDALIRAAAEAPRLTLSTTETDDGKTRVFGDEEVLDAVGARAGNTIVDADSDGILRRVAFTIDGLESFAVVAAERDLGRRVGRAGFDHGEALVDAIGPPGTIPRVSFLDVARGRVPASAFRGKLVLVGATAPSLQDTHEVPLKGRAAMPGVEFLAAATDTLRRGVPLRPLGEVWNVLIVLLAAAVAPLVALRRGPLVTLAAGVVAVVAVLGMTVALFFAGRVADVATPLLATVLATLGALAVAAFYVALDRERARLMFSRFVSEAIAVDLLDRGDGEPRLGGVRVDATVLFCDLRGSTALVERAGPEAGIALINGFLTEMADAVLAHGGTLVGYRGDGLMALFGAPVEQPDHAERALRAAREMAGPRLAAAGEGLKLGVGLDSGEVMAGNVGSPARMEYTAIGDAANGAARVEALTKELGVPVLLSDATRARLGPDAQAQLVEVATRELRGRSAPVTLYRPES